MCRAPESRQTWDENHQRRYWEGRSGNQARGLIDSGQVTDLSAWFSFCDKCKTDADAPFHRKTVGSLSMWKYFKAIARTSDFRLFPTLPGLPLSF